MKSLILEGFMGCGKSRIAKELSEDTGLVLIDTDNLIEKENGMRISQIFESYGEEAFRDMETKLLQKLKNDGKCGIISLGGGMPVREKNREILKELGTVAYLKAGKQLLIKRLEHGVEKRPMLKGHDLEERVDSLLKEREGAYLDAADLVVSVENAEVSEVVFKVRKAAGI